MSRNGYSDAYTQTGVKSEIENPAGLSRHYEEEKKRSKSIFKKKKVNERALYSLHLSLNFSPSPAQRLENSML